MMTYFLQRLLLFVPTLFIISFFIFMLSKKAPGDPVLSLQQGGGILSDFSDLEFQEKTYRETAAFLGLDKPLFYVSLQPAAVPDTLYKFIYPDKKRALKGLIGQYGNWPLIEKYYSLLGVAEKEAYQLPDSVQGNALRQLRTELRLMQQHYKAEVLQAKFATIEQLFHEDPALAERMSQPIAALKAAWIAMTTETRIDKLWYPGFHWYGTENQYHHWISGVLQGDWGKSYLDGSDVSDKIWRAVRWTLGINGVAILLAYLIAVPLGVYIATHANSKRDASITNLLFMLYSLPGFWVATLLVVYFTSPEYGMDWFPALGYPPYDPDRSIILTFAQRLYHLILPVFCLTYGSLAFITRQMRGSTLKVLRQPYIRTAYAKGLPRRIVIWKHAFKNALFPIITLLAGVFPAAISGSFVVEYIFSIPGMGKLTVDAIMARDWPVVYGILMLGALLTVAGILFSDMLYASTDPRVSFSKNQTNRS